MNKIIKLFNQIRRNTFSIDLFDYYFKRTIPFLYYPFVKIRTPKKIVFLLEIKVME